MSAFDDFNTAAFDEASDIIGSESFTITGLAGSFTGILNNFGSAKVIDLGGIRSEVTATLECDPEQFEDLITGPLEKGLDGRKVTIAGREFKITRAYLDTCSLTLGLTNPNPK